ncbi:MAG TPA: hypothetical protein VN968_12495 [Bradyrhizobium sp.]|jgi:hypothetical protein|nr:hypothetical protein [Bradyrhizobium sp.]
MYSESMPLVEKEWGGRPLDLDARSDQRIGKRPMKPSIRSPLPSGLKDDHVASDRPSIGRRIFRTLTRFSIAVLIGIGATLAWQSHGDAARDMVVARAPSLAWLLSVSTTKSPAMAATSPDPAQQLEPLASNLDVVRRSVEQLAAKQEQMAQNMATLQAVADDIRQRMSITPPSSPSQQQAAPIPQHKPPQPRAQSSAVQSSSVPRPLPPAGAPLLSR